MTGSMKTIITLAVAMNIFCFAAMVAPDALDAMGGFSPYPFLAMLLMTLPLLAFGVVTLCRLARRCRNAWFFLKTSAVSQLIVALMALLLVIIMEVEDGGSAGSQKWLLVAWAVAAFVLLLTMRLKKKKLLPMLNTEGELTLTDHLWVMLPMLLFVILFFAGVVMVARSVHFYPPFIQ